MKTPIDDRIAAISSKLGIPPHEVTGIVLRAYDAAIMEKLSSLTEPLRIRIDFSNKPTATTPRKPTPIKRPSRGELIALVLEAQSAITTSGANPVRPATKREHIDRISYSYGLLWGVACALDCSLKEVIERFGHAPKRRRRASPQST